MIFTGQGTLSVYFRFVQFFWRAGFYIARARPFRRPRRSKIRVFFRHFFAKSILETWVVGILSGKFFPWIICNMAFIKKILARATPPGGARANFKNWKIFFWDFPFFQFLNYDIWPVNIRILLRPGYVGHICRSYGLHKPIKPIWFRTLYIAIET